MTEIVCIFGSRDLPVKYKSLIQNAIKRLKPGTIVVAGRARGVDSWAEEAANKRGLEVWPYPAKWKDANNIFNPIAGFERNSDMVEISDRGIAFQYKKSRGTQDTINKFKAEGKPVEIHQIEEDRKQNNTLPEYKDKRRESVSK